jgi:hypothetical protein
VFSTSSILYPLLWLLPLCVPLDPLPLFYDIVPSNTYNKKNIQKIELSLTSSFKLQHIVTSLHTTLCNIKFQITMILDSFDLHSPPHDAFSTYRTCPSVVTFNSITATFAFSAHLGYLYALFDLPLFPSSLRPWPDTL